MSTTRVDDAMNLIRADQQITEVRSALAQLVKDPFTPKTRAAQNMTILLSGLGIAIALGFITVEEFGFGDSKAKFHTGPLSLGLLFLCTSAFLLARFLLFSKENLALHKLETLSAYKNLLEASLPIMKISDESDHRQKELYAEAVEKRMELDDVADKIRKIRSDAEEKLQPYIPFIKYIDRVQKAGKRTNRFRSIVDRIFPIALWFALLVALCTQAALQAGYQLPWIR
jgi:hypothetical protein